MRPLPPDVAGPDNDLADLLDHYIEGAIADPAARLYAFGQRWGPEPQPDKVFGFSPGAGVHDIHMNQGNIGQLQRDEGVWQDGAVLIHFPAEPRWSACFLAFQSQAWHTDDVSGHAITPAPTTPPDQASAVQIVAALVNRVGPAPRARDRPAPERVARCGRPHGLADRRSAEADLPGARDRSGVPAGLAGVWPARRD